MKEIDHIQLLDILFNHPRCCHALFDNEFNFIRVSQPFADLCDRPLEYFPGKNHSHRFSSEVRESFENARALKKPIQANATPFPFEDSSPSGDRYWDWTLEPVPAGRGKGEFLLLTLQEVTGRKVLEKELNDSRRRYESLFNEALDMIHMVSIDGTILDVNDTELKVMGYTREEYIGRSLFDLIHEDYREETKIVASQVFKGFMLPPYETALVTRNGQIVHVEVNVSPFIENGKVAYARAILRDITERKRNEQAIRKSEQEVRSILDDMLDTFYRTDLEGNIVMVSGSVKTLLGYSRDEVMGKKLADFYLEPDGREKFLQEFQQSNGRVIDYQAPLRHRDGHAVWVSTNAHYAHDVDGKVIGVEGVTRDITEGKKADEILKRSKQELEALVKERTDDLVIRNAQYQVLMENAADTFFIHDEQGRLLEWNKHAPDTLGFSAEELEQLTLFDIDVGLQPEHVLSVLHALKPEEVANLEGEHRCKDGRRIAVETRTTAYVHEGRKCYISIARDISQRREAERKRKQFEAALIATKEEAEHANRAKTEFLSRMSHELRTPMNAILGFSQLLELSVTDPQSMENTQEIIKAGKHLLELINEILDLSRIDAGKMELSIEPVRLNQLLDDCLILVATTACKHDIRIVDNIMQNSDYYILADYTRFKQAVLNLLTNAVKYNHPGGSVSLDCELVAVGRLRVIISDTGPGIRESQHQHLFQPFERAGAEFTAIEGTGIGLTITRRLVELMGGAVDFESEEGFGSRFWLDIDLAERPALLEEADIEAVATEDAVDDDCAQQCILHIEDNPANLRLVDKVLSRHGYHNLISTQNPLLGLEMAANQHPALILLDINLPGMDGYQVHQQLKHDRNTQDIPVIAVTASAMSEDIEAGLRAGFYGYVTKPIDFKVLLDLIDSALAGP